MYFSSNKDSAENLSKKIAQGVCARKDPGFLQLMKLAASKGLKLRKQSLGMGFCLTMPDNEVKKFKSFTVLSEFISTYS